MIMQRVLQDSLKTAGGQVSHAVSATRNSQLNDELIKYEPLNPD
jgi:hypothetical protein